MLHDQISDGDGLGDGVSANLAVLLTFDLLPRKALSRCSRTIHTMMRVPLNVGYPPQMAESATMCRPSSTRVRCPSAFAFMPMPLIMRPVAFVCKPVISDESGKGQTE